MPATNAKWKSNLQQGYKMDNGLDFRSQFKAVNSRGRGLKNLQKTPVNIN